MTEYNPDKLYIKILDNEYNKNQYLSEINENDKPLLIVNKETNNLYFAKDGILNRKFEYDNDNYLEFDKLYKHPDFFVIPNGVNKLKVTELENNVVKFIDIPSNYDKINQEPLYKVGLMSDVHYNDADTDMDPDTNITEDGAEYSEDLKNALQFFTDQNVDFVSCSGDISTDVPEHIQNYQLCINKYFSNLPVFTCSGNHDTRPKYTNHDLWQATSALNANNYEVTYFKDYEQYYYKDPETGEEDNCHTSENGEGTSFYIKKYYDDTFDVYIYLNVEYGWNNPNSYDTHNCRGLYEDEYILDEGEMIYEFLEDDKHLYHKQTLICLSNILEEFKDHRCFIFTHLMLSDKAGNFHVNSTSNYESYYPYAYDYVEERYRHADVLRGNQGKFIKSLMEKYDNNYWFCGHSHYKWVWEKYDHNINVTKTGNSYNIHLPSLSRPLPVEIFGYQNAPKDSEGGIMEVYKDYVVIKGVVMKEENNEYDLNTIIQNYPEENLVYATPEMFTVINNESSVEQLEDNYIQINYVFNQEIDSNANNIYLHDNNSNVNASNFGNYIPVLRFEDISIWFDEMDENDLIENITEDILNERKVGFRDHTTDDNYFYYISSNHIYTLDNYALEYANGVLGIVFKTSRDSLYQDKHLHFKFKLKIGYAHVGYINKFLPIACFKLPSIKKEED